MDSQSTMTKPTAILTSDIEIRSHTPVCRTDDHWKALNRKMQWLRDLQEKHKCPVFDGGDLFDKKYKQHPSHDLLQWAVKNIPRPFFTVPGNHDLPGRSVANFQKSAMAVLQAAGVVWTNQSYSTGKYVIQIDRFPWGEKIDPEPKGPKTANEYRVALVHAMVYDRHEPFPGCDGWEKRKLVRHLCDYDLVLCGHNHQTFTATYRNTILVNPGSLMRNDANQMDFEPSVFLWYAGQQKIERVKVPIDPGPKVITRKHLDEVKKKEIRLDAFVEKLGKQAVTGVNFEVNLEAMASEAGNKYITDKIWSYYEN